MSNKQIDEMCEVLRQNSESCKTCRWYEAGLCLGNCELSEDNQIVCEALFNAGYRKATDVAKEIFEEIEKEIADLEYQAKTPRKTVKVEELKAQMNWLLHEVMPQVIAELKKKYTEGESNER